jgi:hypothetical protein
MAAGMCEFLLSQIARVDACPSRVFGGKPGKRFQAMLQGDRADPVVPGRGFITWLKGRYGPETPSLAKLHGIVPVDHSDRLPIDYKTLQSWNSGATVPDRRTAKMFVGAIVREMKIVEAQRQQDEWRQFDLQLWATIRLSRTLHMVTHLCAQKAGPGEPLFTDLLEVAGPEEWCRRRFEFWIDHWSRHWAKRPPFAAQA